MYAIIPQQIPQDRRAEINEKILFAIDSGKDLVPKESIYNCYTGIGGLHNLRQSDFTSYHEYAEAKKEFEMGQFFTPHDICRSMVETLSPTSAEMVLDMCCGMGNFFNHLPNLHNAYGFDIDGKAVAVARYLYPEAHIEKCDIQLYNPEQRFDIIVGNPPFNLKFDYRLSQEFYMDKAYDVLNPAGILMVIVPLSFMQNEFWEKTRVAKINSNFSFIGQTRLEHSAFSTVGVQNFATKIMVFLRRSLHIEMQPYNAEEFVSMDELKKRIAEVRKMKHRLRLQLMRECNHIDKEELEQFEYRLAKYMYELKAHAVLNRHVEKAEALVSKFRNQKPPENATREQIKEWERKKLTTGKVLGIIRRYITSQNVVPRKEVALVKTSYGFKLKQYAPRLLDKVTHKAAGINDLILGRAELPMPENVTEKNMRQIRAASKLIRRKQRQYETQNLQFAEMREDAGLKEYLDRTTFINKDGEVCEFTDLQKHDLNLVLQKRYALLNWQQGSGKTAAVYHRAKYLLKFRKAKNVIILAPGHRHQHDLDTVPYHKQGTLPYNTDRRRPQQHTGRDIPCRLHLHAPETEKRTDAFRETHFRQAVPCLRRVGRNHQSHIAAYKKHPVHIQEAQVQDPRHGNNHPQQHRGTVQPVRTTLQQLRKYDMLEPAGLPRKQGPRDRGREQPGLRNTVPRLQGACPFPCLPLSGESHCIRHRETEPGRVQQGRTLRTYRQNGHHP